MNDTPAAEQKRIEKDRTMKVTVTETTEKEVAYLKAECGVRYWEDATVNGEQDSDDNPRIPKKHGDMWRIVVKLDTGVIEDWPQGITADVHYKVCDAGRYALLDAGGLEVTSIDGYVPDIMCPEGNGYGDYVIMKIDGAGRIDKWRPDLSAFERPAQ